MRCVICGYKTVTPAPRDLGEVRGNTERFKKRLFPLWKCPNCSSIHSLDPVDFRDIYSDYPLNKRRLDAFARATLRNLLKRLRRAGLSKRDSILDYGCGNGIFVRFLREQGYENVAGFDPFVPGFARPPEREYDCVVANDVIEHVPDPRAWMKELVGRVKPRGLLYIGTADSAPVDMGDLQPHIMRLHQPFHRVLITQEGLQALGQEAGLELLRAYRRSYMDTLWPFVNYRFLDEFNGALGHDLDLALDPAAGSVLLRKPLLLFYAFLGYFFPSAYEPAVVLRKRAEQSWT